MRASTAFSVLAIAGSALAAPAPLETVTDLHVVWETVVHTVYATEGYAAPTPPPAPVAEAPKTTGYPVVEPPKPTKEAPKPQPTKEAPKPTTEAYQAPKPTTEAYQAPPAPETTKGYGQPPAPEPTQTYEPPAPPADDGYMGVVNEWRGKMGMSNLKVDSVLVKNAEKVVECGNGVMKHQLFDGTGGQVLAPGDAGNDGFKKVFVGGWLCEMPGLLGLNGVCNEMSKGWAYEGQTGHAEILTDPQYKYIGCALHEGIWCCDVSADAPPEPKERVCA
jgi:uncharacterized protein YkwD